MNASCGAVPRPQTPADGCGAATSSSAAHCERGRVTLGHDGRLWHNSGRMLATPNNGRGHIVNTCTPEMGKS